MTINGSYYSRLQQAYLTPEQEIERIRLLIDDLAKTAMQERATAEVTISVLKSEWQRALYLKDPECAKKACEIVESFFMRRVPSAEPTKAAYHFTPFIHKYLIDHSERLAGAALDGEPIYAHLEEHSFAALRALVRHELFGSSLGPEPLTLEASVQLECRAYAMANQLGFEKAYRGSVESLCTLISYFNTNLLRDFQLSCWIFENCSHPAVQIAIGHYHQNVTSCFVEVTALKSFVTRVGSFLQALDLSRFTEATDEFVVDFLRNCINIRSLSLAGSAVKGLKAGILGHKQLRELRLSGCTSFSQQTLQKLQARPGFSIVQAVV